MYPVCPDRNVPAAFECFFGPDSGSLERFLDERRVRRNGRALSVLQAQARRTFSGTVRELRRGAGIVSGAVADLNPVLARGWLSTLGSVSHLAWASKSLIRFVEARLHTGARTFSNAVADLNMVLNLGWISAFYALSLIAWASKALAYRACAAIRSLAPEMPKVRVFQPARITTQALPTL
jgi:hypothetical protein